MEEKRQFHLTWPLDVSSTLFLKLLLCLTLLLSFQMKMQRWKHSWSRLTKPCPGSWRRWKAPWAKLSRLWRLRRNRRRSTMTIWARRPTPWCLLSKACWQCWKRCTIYKNNKKKTQSICWSVLFLSQSRKWLYIHWSLSLSLSGSRRVWWWSLWRSHSGISDKWRRWMTDTFKINEANL